MIGLYKETTMSRYDDEGDDNNLVLLAVGGCKQELIYRWNQHNNKERLRLRNKEAGESYIRNVPPNFKDKEEELEFLVSNGGGYARVHHHIYMKTFVQFDQKEND